MRRRLVNDDVWVVGLSTCAACAEVTTVIGRVAKVKAGQYTCDACGARRAESVAVFYPAAIVPELLALVQFTEAREQLRLDWPAERRDQ